MSIVCGTDLSESAGLAEVASGHLAARLGETLHLVHAVDISRDALHEEPRSALGTWARRHLDRTAVRLRRIGCEVEVHVEAGPPDEVLVEVAHRVGARVIAVSPHGAREPRRGGLGSHTERLLRDSPIAVLVVRDEAPLVAWAMEGRALRVVVGADMAATTVAATRWLAGLCKSGPCEVIATHVYWPPGEIRRLGLHRRSLVDRDPEVEATVKRDLAPTLAPLEGIASLEVRIEASLGRVADRLAHVAEQESADLIVVGAHQRSALARLRDGSVSRELLQQTDQSVVCVPATAAPRELVVPAFRTVLVATDFSPAGDAAVALALAAAAPGARLHLLHVATEDIEPGGSVAAAEHRAAETRLAELVPSGAGVVTEIHVLSGRDPALVISHVAERLGADLVCLGSHGRTGLGRMLMGSVTQEVIARLRRPILLARPALE